MRKQESVVLLTDFCGAIMRSKKDPGKTEQEGFYF